MISALRVSRPFARMLSTTSSAPATVKATTEAASAAAAPSTHYITFAEYRQQATKQGPLAAVRQAYPRSLNTASEIARAKAAANGTAAH